MNILITGSTGFVGRSLKEGLISNKYILFTPKRNELDLLNTEEVLAYFHTVNIDTVIHCATHDATKLSRDSHDTILRDNMLMFFNLLHAKRLYKKMFYFGSGAEFCKSSMAPFITEEAFDSCIPKDDYGFSKYMMTYIAKSYPHIYNMRLFGCFGKYEQWRIRFISNSICRCIFDLPIIINKNVYFDYLWSEDLVRIMQKMLGYSHLAYTDYNITTGNRIDLITLAKMIITISGKNIKVKVINKGLQQEYTANNDRLMALLGKFTFTPYEESLKKLYKWYYDNKQLIQKNICNL